MPIIGAAHHLESDRPEDRKKRKKKGTSWLSFSRPAGRVLRCANRAGGGEGDGGKGNPPKGEKKKRKKGGKKGSGAAACAFIATAWNSNERVKGSGKQGGKEEAKKEKKSSPH